MQESNRPVVVVGNWKMYKTVQQTLDFVKELLPLIQNSKGLVYLAVPFTTIKSLVDVSKNTPLVIGAQNMHDAAEGAFTGEIAAAMLVEAGARFVILGHSERRRLFHESNAVINKKMKRAVAEKLQSILCIGETEQERMDGLTKEVLTLQLTECLEDIEPSLLETMIIAYEPVWAIGTDLTATPEIAQEAHHLCREWLQNKFGEAFAQKIPLLYGGSVKPDNAAALLEQQDIDGLLVGGASLTVETFSNIVNLT
ncbi:MAG: triose-phosphate isomerase [Parachlamydiaceae bacterium]|nr:triose-phosphate isomerase [Parachlamydiaceae bacterium]